MSTAREACPDCGCNGYSTMTQHAEENLENGLSAQVECDKCGTVYVHVPYVYY